MTNQKRTWAEIYLDRAAHNLKVIQTHTGANVIAVVKADAYGHGALALAHLYESMGIPYLAVACVQEGLELREGGIKTPILVLGMTVPQELEQAIEKDLTLTAYSAASAREISAAAMRVGKFAHIHVKVDTGMSRIGFRFDAADEILRLAQLPNLEPEGIFTHFADAENEDKTFTTQQLERFDTLIERLKMSGMCFKICHCANSAAVLHYKKAWKHYVRAGIILYGWGSDGSLDLKPVMEFKTRVGDLRWLSSGDTVSYGRTCSITEDRKIAVVPAGYADGVLRSLSGCGSFVVRGKHAPICGRVCMDMTMLDVTEIPEVQIGDEVTIFGTEASADALANTAGTISYELCCRVSKRVPRIYFENDGDAFATM